LFYFLFSDLFLFLFFLFFFFLFFFTISFFFLFSEKARYNQITLPAPAERSNKSIPNFCSFVLFSMQKF